ADPCKAWITDPQAVLDSDDELGNIYYLRSVMHRASLSVSNRKYRLSCSGLLEYLITKGGSKLWLARERTSVAIFTDAAYHCGWGRLTL
ncbi:MAG: hypothetical protein WB646_02290, partial [Steroidobacteraceae bacterium]